MLKALGRGNLRRQPITRIRLRKLPLTHQARLILPLALKAHPLNFLHLENLHIIRQDQKARLLHLLGHRIQPGQEVESLDEEFDLVGE